MDDITKRVNYLEHFLNSKFATVGEGVAGNKFQMVGMFIYLMSDINGLSKNLEATKAQLESVTRVVHKTNVVLVTVVGLFLRLCSLVGDFIYQQIKMKETVKLGDIFTYEFPK